MLRPSLVALAFAVPVAASAASPCVDDPRFAPLARWVGEWRIVEDPVGDRLERGTAVVDWILDRCALEEVRRVEGGEVHRSWIHLDPEDGSWRQTWLTSTGDSGAVELEFDGEAVLGEGTIRLYNGDRVDLRVRLEPRPGGGFTELLQTSVDGWRSRTVAPETAYLPATLDEAADAPALPMSRSVPAPPADPGVDPAVPTAPSTATSPSAPDVERAASSTVRIRSEIKQEERIEEVAMESPMVLEFELGPIDVLPEGSGWRTDELSRYVADEVNIPLVTAERSRRRGRSRLSLTVNLRTTAFQRKVTAEAALLAGGAQVAVVSEAGIAIGKMIGSHDRRTGRPVELLFDLDQSAFEQLFADGRPTVQLTIAVE